MALGWPAFEDPRIGSSLVNEFDLKVIRLPRPKTQIELTVQSVLGGIVRGALDAIRAFWNVRKFTATIRTDEQTPGAPGD